MYIVFHSNVNVTLFDRNTFIDEKRERKGCYNRKCTWCYPGQTVYHSRFSEMVNGKPVLKNMVSTEKHPKCFIERKSIGVCWWCGWARVVVWFGCDGGVRCRVYVGVIEYRIYFHVSPIIT